jgi:hypothetical protein
MLSDSLSVVVMLIAVKSLRLMLDFATYPQVASFLTSILLFLGPVSHCD